jgi:hypothetical protein
MRSGGTARARWCSAPKGVSTRCWTGVPIGLGASPGRSPVAQAAARSRQAWRGAGGALPPVAPGRGETGEPDERRGLRHHRLGAPQAGRQFLGRAQPLVGAITLVRIWIGSGRKGAKSYRSSPRKGRWPRLSRHSPGRSGGGRRRGHEARRVHAHHWSHRGARRRFRNNDAQRHARGPRPWSGADRRAPAHGLEERTEPRHDHVAGVAGMAAAAAEKGGGCKTVQPTTTRL